MSDALEIDDLSFGYGSRPVIDHLDLQVHPGEVLALMGESGSGKTTLARLISGFLLPSSGTIRAGGVTLWGPDGHLRAHRRAVGLVPQEGALFPHLSVAGNVGFGLDRHRSDRNARIERCLELVGLGGFGDRRPDELSGGQQQRVAVARAIAPEPRLIILDEPFSALDAALRRTTRQAVLGALRSEGATVILVTHDSHEALGSADRVAVLEAGRTVQVATPAELYDRPATRTIAQSCGPVTGLGATYHQGRVDSALGSAGWEPPEDVTDGATYHDVPTRGTAWYRPEHIEVASEAHDDDSIWTTATVVAASIDGPDLWLTCEIGTEVADGSTTAESVLVRAGRDGSAVEVGDSVVLRASRVTLFEPA